MVTPCIVFFESSTHLVSCESLNSLQIYFIQILHIKQITIWTRKWWLNQCERKHINDFHCTCLMKIMQIQRSFFICISNMQNLAAAAEEHLSTTMIKPFIRITTSNNTHPLRRLVFDNNHRFHKFRFNPIRIRRPKQ